MSDVTSTHDLKNQSSNFLTRIEVKETWHQAYSTTAILLLVIHFFFLYHVLTRKYRSTLLVSYKILIRRKQYHKALPALLSHPPTRLQHRESSSQNNATGRNSGISFILQRIPDWQRSSVLFNGKRWSGLPLLFYNSFILWNCLWGLAVVALVLDVSFTHYVFSVVRDMNYGTSSPFLMGANWANRRNEFGRTSRGVERVKRILTHRTIGSLTLVTSGVLAIFQNRFPFVPLPILPFLSTRIPLLSSPAFSYALCLGILSLLSHPVHPLASIFCGTLSGMLWASNVTSFLMEPYWSNGIIIVYAVLCALSLKASGSVFVPCVDHVPWDSHGHMTQMQQEESSVQSSFVLDSSSHSDSSTDSTFEESSERPQATLPLFTNQEDEIHHSLPSVGGLGDDEDESEYYPLVAQNAATTVDPSNNTNAATMRSRRAPRP
jgi:hypothetical protein